MDQTEEHIIEEKNICIAHYPHIIKTGKWLSSLKKDKIRHKASLK